MITNLKGGRKMAEIYTPDEIARKLKVSEQTVRRYLRENKIKGFKLGNNLSLIHI